LHSVKRIRGNTGGWWHVEFVFLPRHGLWKNLIPVARHQDSPGKTICDNMRRISIRLIPIAIAAVIVGMQYCSSEKFTNEAGRTAHVGLSSEQEERLGLQSYQQILSQVQTIRSGREYELVRNVAMRLAGVVGKEAHDYQWDVSLVRSGDINAFCLPGGKIVVYTGILPVAETEEGLATVMGHEMAHATARHGSERLLRQRATQTLMTGVQFSMGDMSYEQQRAVMAALGAGAQVGFLLPFSRDHESEADSIGLMYMARAGYDPRAAVAFWERMTKASRGNQPPEFLSTHPSHGTRIERLKAAIPKALEEYERRR
jgi:predicted Zn-dependent protease